ncbi:hypothetical protein DKG77_13340 [Flagellimonas aquimarina]|uniref:DUF1080 domain-containing protein n=1 Tax=Flagellimonas aquimarina TaxID=2201895 RepID=A0A316L0S5_9FLAO|nr:hypothetical protein [Allomuricauda koreensis]PWL37753.1 hypothetical protein DKG77_13340 [Allomuricauda koreensis]
MKSLTFLSFLFILSVNLTISQQTSTKIGLYGNSDLIPINVIASDTIYKGMKALRVLDTGISSEAKFVKIPNLNFESGTIEIELSGAPMKDAPANVRGFVGLAFRVHEDDSKFECFYLRPTNARAQNQIRRNHSVQYISYPEFPWHKLRKEFPKKYETYVDLVPGDWTKVRIVVEGNTAQLYVHGNDQPTLIVNDLKHGTDNEGTIGLWIGPGTEAYFTNLTVVQ